jgi:TRAP-type C4-dicarboxylate transport system substrate-binding protein
MAQIKKAGVEVIENIDTEPFRSMVYQPVRKLYADKFGPELLNKIDAAQ